MAYIVDEYLTEINHFNEYFTGIGIDKGTPKIGFVIIISGAKLKNQTLAEKAYSVPMRCPSVHFLGAHFVLFPCVCYCRLFLIHIELEIQNSNYIFQYKNNLNSIFKETE